MNATQARIHMLFVMPLFNKYMRIVYQQFHNMSQSYFIFNKLLDSSEAWYIHEYVGIKAILHKIT